MTSWKMTSNKEGGADLDGDVREVERLKSLVSIVGFCR